MRKISSIYIYLVLLLLTTYSCKEDESGMNVAPTIEVIEVDTTTIYRRGATLAANIHNDDGRIILECGFIISESSDFKNMSLDDVKSSLSAHVLSLDSVITNGDISYNVRDLEANTTYYYQAYVYSGFSSQRSEILSFTTMSTSEPVFSDIRFSNITLSSCTASFEIIDLGGDDKLTTLQFLYREVGDNETVESLNHDDCKIVDASAYTKTIDNLSKNTRYAICAELITDAGRTATGKVCYFKTTNYDVQISTPEITVSDGAFKATSIITTEDSIIAEGLFYSRENTSPNENNFTAADNNLDKTIELTVDSLEEGTYYIRAYGKVQKSGSTFFVYSETAKAQIYTTIYPAPVVDACTVTDITTSSFVVSSKATKVGYTEIKERGFCFVEGKSTPTIDNDIIAVGSNKEFKATINGLKYNTDYTIRAYAINEQGTMSYGAATTVHTEEKSPNADDNIFPEF